MRRFICVFYFFASFYFPVTRIFVKRLSTKTNRRRGIRRIFDKPLSSLTAYAVWRLNIPETFHKSGKFVLKRQLRSFLDKTRFYKYKLTAGLKFFRI